jgi:hypothetical protein
MTRPPKEETNMARALSVLLLVLGVSVLFAVACDNEDDFLLEDTDPEATETPAFFQRTPLPSPEPSPVGSPAVAGATPVTPFEIEVDQTVNLRTAPSTEEGEDTVAGSMTRGDKATVIARIPGEAVEPDNDVWYQLEDGNFVYSGAVSESEVDESE